MEQKSEKSFDAIDEALSRQPLLKLALALDKEIHSKIVSMQARNTEANEAPTMKLVVLDNVLQKMRNVSMYLLKDCVSGLDVRSKENTEGIVEFYEPANEIVHSTWKRLLMELLVDLRLFRSTDEEVFFRHYALFKERDQAFGKRRDLLDFFDCPSNLWHDVLLNIDGEISRVEKDLDISRCWYGKRINQQSEHGSNPSYQIRWSSFRKKLMKALPQLTEMEKQLVGLTYVVGYSDASEKIHAGLFSSSLSQSEERFSPFDTTIQTLSVFSLSVYENVLDLLYLDKDDEWVASVKKMIHVNEEEDKSFLRQIAFKPEIEMKDFVSVEGKPGQVLDINVSKFSYRSFLVKFIGSNLPPREDWIPAPNVKLFQKISEMRREVREKMNLTMIDGKPMGDLFTDAQLDEKAAEGWTRVFDDVREHLAKGFTKNGKRDQDEI